MAQHFCVLLETIRWCSHRPQLAELELEFNKFRWFFFLLSHLLFLVLALSVVVASFVVAHNAVIANYTWVCVMANAFELCSLTRAFCPNDKNSISPMNRRVFCAHVQLKLAGVSTDRVNDHRHVPTGLSYFSGWGPRNRIIINAGGGLWCTCVELSHLILAELRRFDQNTRRYLSTIYSVWPVCAVSCVRASSALAIHHMHSTRTINWRLTCATDKLKWWQQKMST